jgi:hypothetical protein
MTGHDDRAGILRQGLRDVAGQIAVGSACAFKLLALGPDMTPRLLSAAAERSGNSAQELALRILIGTVHKGSIDKAANFFYFFSLGGSRRRGCVLRIPLHCAESVTAPRQAVW